MTLHDAIEEQLTSCGVSVAEWQELLIRLLNHGVLCRDEKNQTERDIYDRFVRCETLVSDYLSYLSLRLQHDRRFCFVRVYPPGAAVPGMEGSEDSSFSGSLRERLSQQEVALLLVLRVQYDKAVREGRMTDQGWVNEPMEAIGIAMKNLLGRPLPENKTERRQVLQRLKKLRLIDFRQDDDVVEAESWLRIHPMIVDFVSTAALETLQQSATTTATPEVKADVS